MILTYLYLSSWLRWPSSGANSPPPVPEQGIASQGMQSWLRMARTNTVGQGAIALLGALVRRFSKAEYVIVLAIFVTLFAMSAGYKLIRVDEMRGDSAMYFQGVENLAN